MKPFYQVACFIIDSVSKQEDFILNRQHWYLPERPVLYAYTTHYHDNGTFHAVVNCYRRNACKDAKGPHDGKVA